MKMKLSFAGLILLVLAAGASEKGPAADALGDLLPPGALARLGTVRWHHGRKLSHLAFAAGGKEIVTAGPDGFVRVWDVANGKELRRCSRGPDGPPCAVALTPDGTRAAIAERDGTVRVWDVATGKQTLRLATGHKGGICAVALSPGGKRLASRGLDRAVIVWDMATGKELSRLKNVEAAGPPGQPEGGGDSLAFSPDGTVLAISFADLAQPLAVGVRLWDVTAGKDLLRIADRHRASGEAPRERPATFSPDGKIEARVIGNGVTMYDAGSGKKLRRVVVPAKDTRPEQAAFSPGGKLLAVLTGRETVSLHDVATGKQVRELGRGTPGYSHRPGDADGRRIAFSPDGKLLAGVWGDNTVRLWDVTTGRERALPAGHVGAVLAVTALDDNNLLTFGADGTLRRWRADTGKLVDERPIPGQPALLAPSYADVIAVAPDGRTVAIQNNRGLSVWDVAAGRERRGWASWANWWFFSLKLSPDGKLLAGLNHRHSIHVRDITTGNELPPLAEELPDNAFPRWLREVVAYEFAPDGRTLFTLTVPGNRAPAGTPRSTLRLWDVASGRSIRQWHSDEGAGAVAFSPDCRTVAVATEKHLVLWELSSGKERWRFQSTGGVPAFSPDGRLLAVGEREGVRVWDVRAGKELGRLAGHAGPVLGMSFTPDGRALLTASADSTALVWDAARLSRAIVPPPAKLTAKEVESFWDDLAGADAGRTFRAVVGLGGAPRQSVAWLRDHLKSMAADPKAFERWVADLDSDSFATREKASRELENAGEAARPALDRALAGRPSPEVRRRLKELLRRLRSEQDLSGSVLRQLRAVEALEQAATPEARRLLEELAEGRSDARLTREATTVLGRWPRK
jgi:WD40 repeat protein